MRILLTGCSGFLGTHLTNYVMERGHEVIGIDRRRPGTDLLRWIDGDVRDYSAWRESINIPLHRGPDPWGEPTADDQRDVENYPTSVFEQRGTSGNRDNFMGSIYRNV